MKLKIAIFDLTDCEGCELEFFGLKEKILDLIDDYEIVNWRFIQNKDDWDFDIALVEGAVTMTSEIDLLKRIRKASRMVVAFGNCALNGNIPAMVKKPDRPRLTKYVYGPDYQPLSDNALAIGNYIKVDADIPGCPVDPKAIEEFFVKIKQMKSTPRPATERARHVSTYYITKIEGHGSLKINFPRLEAKLQVEEGERLFEGLLLGRPYIQAPYITSRICGICPTAHNLTSIKALENALGVKPSKATILLRRLMLSAQVIQSHLIHLFYLALPDYYGEESGLEIAQKYPAEFHIVLNLKRLSDKILEIVGGRAIHPTTTAIGGFTGPPNRDRLIGLRDDVADTLDEAEDLLKIFQKLPYPQVTSKTQYLTLAGKDYPLYEGAVKDYPGKITETSRSGSSAKIALLNNRPFMVGALARVTLHQRNLRPKAKKYFDKLAHLFSKHNPFYNNLAQAIEILHSLEETGALVEELVAEDLNTVKAGPPAKLTKIVSGSAVIEAPRGLLYHYYKISPDGAIADCNIITPTVCNLGNLEQDANALLKATRGLIESKRRELLEMLIRAYDPCITCSVH